MPHTSPTDDPQPRRSALDRLFALVTDVRPGEGLTALLLAANVFCLLALYYVLKTVRESLILTEGGAEVKSYAAAGQALLLLIAVPAYAAVASRVNRLTLVSGVTLFFASHLVIFAVLGAAGFKTGLAFFLWLGVFNLVVVAQFWSFANDVYTRERGKRLFPIVGIGSALGAWAGAQIAGALFSSAGPQGLLLAASAGLVVCVLLTVWVHLRERRRAGAEPGETAERPLARSGAFRLVFRQRYLLLIAAMVVLVNLVNTIGEFLLGSLVVQEAARAASSGDISPEAFIGRFYGRFYGSVNLVGFLFQAFLVSRIFKYLGVGGALFILPVVSLVSYGSLAFVPILGVVRLVKILENGTDYSINNTSRHALFLPTSREAKYKAKQAIDSFFWRAGDVLQALVVFAGARLAFAIRDYAMLNLLFVGLWLAIVAGIVREYRKLAPSDTGERMAA